MGSGASMEASTETKAKVKEAVGASSDKRWLEANDVADLKAAKAELKRLRALAAGFCLEPSSSAGAGGGGAARKAVMDRGLGAGEYVKKAFDKTPAVKAMITNIMKDNILFKNCKPDEAAELVEAFEPMSVPKGTDIIRQGEDGENFYIIETGEINITLVMPGGDGSAQPVGTLSSGMGFGELALMYGTPRAATCTTTADTKIWTVTRTTFRQIAMHFKKARSEKYVSFLSNVTIASGDKSSVLGSCLSKKELGQLADALEEESFSPGDMIIRQGEAGDYFYIIESGKVDVHVDKKAGGGKVRSSVIVSADTKIASLEAGAIFGEKALLSEDVRNASIKATTPVTCLTLGREDFTAMLGSVAELLSGASREEEVVDAGSTRAEEAFSLDDFDQVRTLGHGAFGRVKMMKHKKNGGVYALKCQGKKAIVDNCLQDHILMERHILMMLDHPFILKLYAAMQDLKYIYFVLELLLGGELFTWLRKQGRFDEPGAKFYSAQVVLGFQHMHQKKVAYRDLKPENLVLDDKGYLKIVDLGLAKVVDGKTWTLCGTPDYLAPEIILNEGHDKAVDYWALGVLIYELVAGIPPFYADDPMEVYEKILSSNMSFPQHFTKNLTDIVRKLLKLCQSKRLGNGKGGCGAIIKHKWFSGFDWEGLKNYELPSPITIKLSSTDDASNFDAYEDEPDDAVDCPDWTPDMNAPGPVGAK